MSSKKAGQPFDYIEQGDKLLRTGDLLSAERLYQKALEADPASAEALYSMGCVASRRMDHSAAEGWARRALRANPGHKPASWLLGNSLFGLSRYKEALDVLKAAKPGEKDIEPLAQIGLLHEKLGQWREAESEFRSVLERISSTYTTRYAPVAVHDHSPFSADIHHALARVLQRQGDQEQAWLHYHLARRVDPTIDLDPMYKEILTEADIEDHPLFDRKKTAKPTAEAPLEKRVSYVLGIREYDELEKAVKALNLAPDKDNIVQLIRGFQREGRILFSARFRVIGDVANGDDARQLLQLLTDEECLRLLELAEQLSLKKVETQEAVALASRVEIPSFAILPLVDLVRRFIRLEPDSSMSLSRVVRACFKNNQPDAVCGYGEYLWGEWAYAVRNFSDAEKALDSACKYFERSGALDYALTAFEKLCTVQRDRDTKLAEATARRFVALAQNSHNPSTEISALAMLSQYQAANGDYDGSHRTASEAAELVRRHGAPAHIQEGINVILARTGSLIRREPTVTKSDEGSHDVVPKGLSSIIGNAERLLEDGKLEEAFELLHRAKEEALDTSRFAEVILCLFEMGRIEHSRGKLVEARDLLSEALGRAEPLAASLDPVPIIAELSFVAESEGNQAQAVEYMERALIEARRRNSQTHEAFCHERLARLLANGDSERAIEHFGQYLALRIPEPQESNDDNPLQRAKAAFEDKNYPEAIAQFEMILADTALEQRWTEATFNLGLAHYLAGNGDRALKLLSEAVEMFIRQGRNKGAVDALERLIRIQQQAGLNTDSAANRLIRFVKNSKSKGERRHFLSQAAALLADLERYSDAEPLAMEALEIVQSKEWREQRLEMECVMTLGRICRLTARYKDSIEYYEQGLAIAKRLKDEPVEGRIHGWKAVAHRYLGQLDTGLDEYRTAIEIAQRYRDVFDEATHRMNMVSTLLEMHRRDEALESAIAALSLSADADNNRLTQRILAQIGAIWNKDELPKDIQLCLSNVDPASLRSSDSVTRGMAMTREALSLFDKGNHAEGMRLFDRVILLYAQIGDRYNQAAAYLNRGRKLLSVGEVKLSISDITAAKDLAQLIQQDALALECDEFLLEIALFERESSLVERTLSKLIPAWIKARRELRTDKDRIQYSGRVAPIAEKAASFFLGIRQVGKAFDLLEFRRAQALADLMAGAALPSGAASGDPATHTDEDGDGTTQLSRASVLLERFNRPAVLITLGYVDNELIAMSLRRGEDIPRVYRTGLLRREASEWLNTFRLEMYQFRGRGAITWIETGRKLLASFAEAIKQDDLVVFVVEDELQLLPLSVLPLPDNQPLIRRAAVSYAPSVTILKRIDERRKLTSKKRLELASVGIAFVDEALAVTRVLPGVALTGNHLQKDNLMQFVQGKSIVHLACHGHFDAKLPMFSGLHLRSPGTNFLADILTVKDLADQHIDADLAVLSACETGLGEPAATEFLGLTRSLLAASARSVIATLWPVRRFPTRDFMLALYRSIEAMNKDGKYIDVAESLRRAQLEFSGSSDLYDWAPFKLLGWPGFVIEREKAAQ
jgi:tetratricopeptide (TPR) repeat protein